MSSVRLTIWTQWPDLVVPDGVRVLSGAEVLTDAAALDEIEVYVPTYMGGAGSLEPIVRMPRLRLVQMATAGYEDVLTLLPPGVTLCNAKGVHSAATAELAVGLAIAGRRGLHLFRDAQNRQEWMHVRRPTLTDSTIAIVGAGDIGGSVARLLSSFDVQVRSYSRTGSRGSRPIEHLAAEIGSYDVVILTTPLTDETRHLMDRSMLGLMRDGALLVNVARGPVVDTDALIVELRSGRLNAALDVVDPEPLPAGHPLWSLPNCVVTPHVGGDTSAFEPRMRELLRDQLDRLCRSGPLEHVVAGPK